MEDQSDEPKTLPEQELEKIKSNLGRLILKEEKEKAVHFRRKTQSLPDRTHMHTSTAQCLLPLVLFQDQFVLSFCLLFPHRPVNKCFQVSFTLRLRLDQGKVCLSFYLSIYPSIYLPFFLCRCSQQNFPRMEIKDGQVGLFH